MHQRARRSPHASAGLRWGAPRTSWMRSWRRSSRSLTIATRRGGWRGATIPTSAENSRRPVLILKPSPTLTLMALIVALDLSALPTATSTHALAHPRPRRNARPRLRPHRHPRPQPPASPLALTCALTLSRPWPSPPVSSRGPPPNPSPGPGPPPRRPTTQLLSHDVHHMYLAGHRGGDSRKGQGGLGRDAPLQARVPGDGRREQRAVDATGLTLLVGQGRRHLRGDHMDQCACPACPRSAAPHLTLRPLCRFLPSAS